MKDPVETIQEGFVILLHAVGAGHIEKLNNQGATFLYRRIADANDRLQLFNRLPERSLIENLIRLANEGDIGWITVKTLPNTDNPRAWRVAVLAQPQATINKMYLEMIECEGCEDELSLETIPVRKYPAAAS